MCRTPSFLLAPVSIGSQGEAVTEVEVCIVGGQGRGRTARRTLCSVEGHKSPKEPYDACHAGHVGVYFMPTRFGRRSFQANLGEVF